MAHRTSLLLTLAHQMQLSISSFKNIYRKYSFNEYPDLSNINLGSSFKVIFESYLSIWCLLFVLGPKTKLFKRTYSSDGNQRNRHTTIHN